MKLARIFTLAALLFLPALALAGGLDIRKARYGRDTKYRDVKDIIKAHLLNNDLSFRVTNESMGGEVNRGQDDYLFLSYEVDGREFTDTVKNGEVFTFKGVAGIRPDRGFILPPAAPQVAPLTIVNDSTRTVLVYALDLYGRWVWQTELLAGQKHATRGVVGQRWKVTSRTNEILRDTTVRTGENRCYVIGAPVAPPVAAIPLGGGQVRVRIENVFPGTVYIYQVDRTGGWNWVAQLDTGGAYAATSSSGAVWIVTDRRGRTLREFRAGSQATVRVAY